MIKEVELTLRPDEVANSDLIRHRAISKSGVSPKRVDEVRVVRRSIDARSRRTKIRLRVAVYIDEVYSPAPALLTGYREVDKAPEIHIVGAGPAGYFAALELIELGLKPIVLDRGKDVRSRRRDLRAIQQVGEVNPNSNYCFGEGGAGTYSDGKLYTRSLKRGSYRKVLRLLVEHGATEDILIDAHPHIGSNKLPAIVANLRATIEQYGGEVRFNSKVTDLRMDAGQITALQINGDKEVEVNKVLLATGHSARDIYYMLARHHLTLEAKPYALGVRIEHPQPLIDEIQYHANPRSEYLPAAPYRLATQVEGRGVFSFCMCPGGLVVPASTAPGELVVNGMSLSRRDSPYANSGTVVALELEDLVPFADQGVFAGLAYQKQVEQTVFAAGDGTQAAPAQRLPDFIAGKVSTDLPDSSYIPGLYSAPVHELLPKEIVKRLQRAAKDFERKMRGYLTREANVIATESRTSSPIRIPRHRETFLHPDLNNLYPCGEGAGYAGGILSAAMDGQNVARAIKGAMITEK